MLPCRGSRSAGPASLYNEVFANYLREQPAGGGS